VKLPPLSLSLSDLLLGLLDPDPHGLNVGSGGSDDLSLVGSNTGDLDFESVGFGLEEGDLGGEVDGLEGHG